MTVLPVISFVTIGDSIRTEARCGTTLVGTIDEWKNHYTAVIHFVYGPDKQHRVFKTRQECMDFIMAEFRVFFEGLELTNA